MLRSGNGACRERIRKKMILFHADLDNTLIYSYKRNIGSEKKGVEIYEGRTVSYMTPESFRRLKEISRRTLFIPTTTRTEEQYARIDFGIGTPRLALVCNGGVLLKDGTEVKEWYEESLEMIGECRGELARAEEYLQRDRDRSFEVRNIRNLFVFTKSENPQKTAEALTEILDPSKMSVFRTGVKVYALPSALNKGCAVGRLKRRLAGQDKAVQPSSGVLSGADYVIAAGDSEFDLSMAEEADLFFAPDTLAAAQDRGRTEIFRTGEGGVFSDYLLQRVAEIAAERGK